MNRALLELETTPNGALMAIDGFGGVGKSTLARWLEAAATDRHTVDLDDFFLPTKVRPHAGDVRASGWRRLVEQVIDPLRSGTRARYQRYNWDTDELDDWIEIEAGSLVIVEGLYSLRRELRDRYDLTVWMDCPDELRVERMVDRDGPAERDLWIRVWHPAELDYATTHAPQEVAHFFVDGVG